MANIFQLVGLLFDLTGVILMARDILKIDKTIGTWDHIDNAAVNAKRNRNYTIKGIVLIGIGFLFQALSTFINMIN